GGAENGATARPVAGAGGSPASPGSSLTDAGGPTASAGASGAPSEDPSQPGAGPRQRDRCSGDTRPDRSADTDHGAHAASDPSADAETDSGTHATADARPHADPYAVRHGA